jgi:SAM-dependent methyltransferase
MNAREVADHWEANAEVWTLCSRAGYDVYRDALNTPAFLAMLPPITRLEGLDVGCGEGSNTRKLAERGARIWAVDVAPTFIRYADEAETAEPRGIHYQVGDAMALPFPDGRFDFVTAFMSLMDVPDPALALREAQRVLRPGGFLQFSILHPCFVPPYRKVLREESGKVRAIEIAGYFEPEEGRIDTWWFGAMPREGRGRIPPFRIPRFHRTLSAWVEIICAAGLVIQEFREPSASPEIAKKVPAVADTRVAGIFLHIRAGKPAAPGP